MPCVGSDSTYYNGRLSACAAALHCRKRLSRPTAAPTPTPTAVARAAAPYRAVWVSYLEWEQVDFSSAEAFHAGNRHNAGQYTVDWRNRRAGAGAALR